MKNKMQNEEKSALEIWKKALDNLGFGAITEQRDRKEYSEEEILAQAMPEDLFSFGNAGEISTLFAQLFIIFQFQCLHGRRVIRSSLILDILISS